jgi:hypothetical protein
MKNILGILLIATTLFYSCDKTRIAGRQFKNSTWKITKIEVLPISNDLGSIQCATETSLTNAGGIVFEKTNGRMAYTNPIDSSKLQFEFFYQVQENEAAEFELQIEPIGGLPRLVLIFDPLDTRKDKFTGYYQEINTCGDLVKYTFYLERYELYEDSN